MAKPFGEGDRREAFLDQRPFPSSAVQDRRTGETAVPILETPPAVQQSIGQRIEDSDFLHLVEHQQPVAAQQLAQ